MRAAVTTGGGAFEITELPDPTPGPGELVVRVAACGVCGSDIKAQPFLPPGTVMGHELGGEVVGVGPDAGSSGSSGSSDSSAWAPGGTVAVLPVVSCGTCAWCTHGDVAHCPSVRFIGMGADAGGFAELAVVPARHAFPLPPDLPPSHAALVEPFAVGLHGASAAEIGPGDHVLVVGAGGVGLTTAAWARALGAERVTVADPDPTRREAATSVGATDVLASVAGARARGYHALVECVGRPELVEACAAAARPRGRIVISGACERPFSVEPIAGLLDELTYRFSVAYRPSDFLAVIDAFATGAIDPTKLLGPTVALDRIGDAFEMVRTASAEGRVLVSPVAPSRPATR
jgi:(R,R)-butanediol dehydrogenase/meso-butanediol dehydrogenase/diacetyl reductase